MEGRVSARAKGCSASTETRHDLTVTWPRLYWTVEGNVMIDKRRWASAGVVSLGLVGLALASAPGSDEPPPRPRPGLTAQQTKEAVKLAHGAMVELRKKTEGASSPGADVREYVVGVELLSSNESTPSRQGIRRRPPMATYPNPRRKRREKEAGTKKDTETVAGPRAVVTSVSLFRRHHGLFDRGP